MFAVTLRTSTSNIIFPRERRVDILELVAGAGQSRAQGHHSSANVDTVVLVEYGEAIARAKERPAVAHASAPSLSLTFALGVHDRGDHRVSQLVGGLQTCLPYARLPVDPEADLIPNPPQTRHACMYESKQSPKNVCEIRMKPTDIVKLAPQLV